LKAMGPFSVAVASAGVVAREHLRLCVNCQSPGTVMLSVPVCDVSNTRRQEAIQAVLQAD